jgi:hypothetical protein
MRRPGTAWFFGIAVPIAMVVLDPAVFKSTVSLVGPPILGRFKAAGYTGIALGVGVMVIALMSTRSRALVSGALAGGCAFSLALGVAILPFSLLGALFLGVGLLGLSPFLSAVTFGWRARRSYREAPRLHRHAMAALGLLIFVAVPLGFHHLVSSSYRSAVDCLLSNRADGVVQGIAKLRPWSLLVDSDQLVLLWRSQMDVRAQQRVAAAYQGVFGGDISERANEMTD